MTTIVKYTFEGRASDLRLAHIPPNGGIISVCVNGSVFEVRALDGLNSKRRSFMARSVTALNSFDWHWHAYSMAELRDYLGKSAQSAIDARDRKAALLSHLDIKLAPLKPFEVYPMTAKQKRELLALLMAMPAELVRRSLDNPNRFMSSLNLALHKVALRRMGAL